MVLTMKNKNYESMRAFLVTGLFVCACGFTQVQANDGNQLTASAPHAMVDQSLTDTADVAEINTTITGEAQFALLVQNIESEFGPFDSRLSEPLLSVGDMLAERGAYIEALVYLERALHIMRINYGLYSEAHIPVVERLIDSNVALEDWDAVDANFRHLEFLYTRLFEQGSEQWYYGIAQVADWHIVAINHNLGDDLEDHLRAANKLFKQRLSYVEKIEDVDQEVIDVLRHNVEYTALHLRKQESTIKTERIYTRLESRYRDDPVDGLASLD